MTDEIIKRIIERITPIIKEELYNFFPDALPLKRSDYIHEGDEDDEENEDDEDEENEENEERYMEKKQEEKQEEKLISILGLDVDNFGRANIGGVCLYTLKMIKEHYLKTGKILLPNKFIDNQYNRGKLKAFLQYKESI